jgi:ATP-dependent Clp protease ATP-binding subunit ClpC
MDLSKYNLTPSAKKAIEDAEMVAETFGHLKVIDLHLLLSLMHFPHANIDYTFESNGIIKDGFIKGIDYVLSQYKEPKRKKKIYAPEIIDLLDSALVFSKKFKDEYIGIDHILLSILMTRKEISDFLISLEIDLEKIIKDLMSVIKSGIPEKTVMANNPQIQEKKPNKITDWCENLNEKVVKRGDYEIFGREKEIERIFEILLKKTKSNVILVGEAGVGKTAVVEGVAEKIIGMKCPDLLLHKQILSLDVTSVLAGTMYRGQMEEKLKKIIDQLSEQDQYILFIDEIHNIVGAGGGTDGALDFANIMKPALSRGQISCIGATTKQEYERFFKKDSALNRRFEKIDIEEPSKKETLKLLKSAKKSYEKFHQVIYKDEVVEAIVDLCDIYLTNKKFPDKAFDILDESGAITKKHNVTRPKEAKKMEIKLTDFEFQKHKDFNKYHKKYSKIIQDWGDSLKDKIYNVDIEVIYDIFASKLNTSKEDIKSKKNIPLSGKIGF